MYCRMRLVAADLNPAMIEDTECGAGSRGPRRGDQLVAPTRL